MNACRLSRKRSVGHLCLVATLTDGIHSQWATIDLFRFGNLDLLTIDRRNHEPMALATVTNDYAGAFVFCPERSHWFCFY